jgi:hypothetical protein
MSAGIQYEELEVEVRSIGKKRYEVRVLSSGRAASKFTPPYAAEKLAGLLTDLEGRVCASSRAGRDMGWADSPNATVQVDIEKLGKRLFKALFPPPVERRLREKWIEVQKKNLQGQHLGLRIRITFDRPEDLALLATQPWEFLCDNGRFINCSRDMPLVRSMNTGALRPIPSSTGPLRVLLIPSNPKGVKALNIAREARLIKQALRAIPEVEIVTMKPTTEALARLTDQSFDIVHFMGHGDILKGKRKDRFVLYFEGKNRQPEPVPSSQLARYLEMVRGLRLVVLNSCWSGALPRESGQDPFSGVGAALIESGVPAVVAMQFPVSDDAAVAFSRAFYERLAARDCISAAATMGRLAILDQEEDTLEWATPIVMLGGEDFSFGLRPGGEPPTETKGSSKGPRPESDGPIRLAIQSFKDPYLSDTEPPHAILDLTAFFRGRYIKEAALWQEEVYPRLAEFLLPYAKEKTPILLDLAAHLTLAFASGYCLEAKAGADVTVLQRSQTRVWRFRAEPGPPREGPLWQEGNDLVLSPQSSAVAVAVSATVGIVDDVTYYLKKSRRAVGRLIPATIYPKPSSTSVEDGRHALQLAQSLAEKIRERSVAERRRPLHLFAAAPNALLFFLGQLARSFGPVQLYEHDFQSGKPGAYMPSLRLPVP